MNHGTIPRKEAYRVPLLRRVRDVFGPRTRRYSLAMRASKIRNPLLERGLNNPPYFLVLVAGEVFNVNTFFQLSLK